jgi:DNA-binding GntR family transcriptional regulator
VAVTVQEAASLSALTRGTAPTLTQRVMEAIQAAIVKGELAPGTKLREPELARRYGVSRGPLREAIRRLEARRLVQVTPHAGARVTELDVDQLLDIFRTREALEGMACRLCAERMSSADIDGLRRLLDAHAIDIERTNGKEYFQREGELDFHYRIAQASGNSIIAKILCDDLYHLTRMYRYQFSQLRDRPQDALDEHRRIIEAIANRDGELADLLMRRHIAASRKGIESLRIGSFALATSEQLV